MSLLEEKTKAVQTLVNGLKLATRRGAFELEEVAQLAEAIEVLKKPEPLEKEDEVLEQAS